MRLLVRRRQRPHQRDERRRAQHETQLPLDFLVGVTQALIADAIVQSNLTYSRGHGYYSDPYKPLDTRPDERRIFAWLTRYNQYFPEAERRRCSSATATSTIRSAHSNMVEAAWVQALP